MTTPEQVFLQQLEANMGIVHKIVLLYVDHPDDRRDLQQEILYQAWKAFPGFQGRSKFSTWLYRISLNTVLTYRRRQNTTTESLEHIREQPVAAPESTDNAERLHQAIRQLPETERALVVLQLDGFSNEDIADITGLTKNHVAVKLHRIKNELIKRLNYGSSTGMEPAQ